MSVFQGLNDTEGPASRPVDRLSREIRDSVALVLITLAVVVTVSFVGLALT